MSSSSPTPGTSRPGTTRTVPSPRSSRSSTRRIQLVSWEDAGMSNLDGKVAIVTGAGRGLGRSHALLLAQRRRAGRRQRPRRRVGRHRLRQPAGAAGRRGDRGHRRQGRRQLRQLLGLEGRRGPRQAGRRHVRRPGHPRQQRRHPARQDELQHGRVRLGLGHRRPPQGPLRAVALRREVLAQPSARPATRSTAASSTPRASPGCSATPVRSTTPPRRPASPRWRSCSGAR